MDSADRWSNLNKIAFIFISSYFILYAFELSPDDIVVWIGRQILRLTDFKIIDGQGSGDTLSNM